MNIRCPQCQTTFRVDASRIPPQGARARCARCGNKFTIRPPGPVQAHTVAPAATRPPAPRPAPPPQPPPAPPSFQTPHPPSAVHSPAGHSAPPHAASPVHGTAAVAQRERAPAAAPVRPSPAKPGARDPNARAERLARALVSDIVAYHPERRDRSLADGSLRTEFRDEILKSWEEYVAQVGISLARSTPYFREALNTILARGQQLF